MGEDLKEQFDAVWVVDFEFGCLDGEFPEPHCFVAKELFTGRIERRWVGEGIRYPSHPPYGVGPKDLFVAFNAVAELSCHYQLGWDQPRNVLDLMVEFRRETSGLADIGGQSLLAALLHYGVPGLDKDIKHAWQQRAAMGGTFSEEERRGLLEYCEEDVDATAALFRKMEANVDLPRALFRGRYMKAVAAMERFGVPVETPLLMKMNNNWHGLRQHVIKSADHEFGVFDDSGSFSNDKFKLLIERMGIDDWPKTKGLNRLSTSKETFRDMNGRYPALKDLSSLIGDFRSMNQNTPSIGSDGRNRFPMRPFSSKTGRNQPSSSKALPYAESWRRNFIQPSPGHGLILLDYDQQEFGIGAWLSRDETMMDVYKSADPYVQTGVLWGVIPQDGTKKSHPDARRLVKQCLLALQYLMGAKTLGQKIGLSLNRSKELVRAHRASFGKYWAWLDSNINLAASQRYLETPLGWKIHLDSQSSNPRSFANFPLQATASDILRVACVMAVERGIKVVCPIHDALLVEAPIDCLGEVAEQCSRLMVSASEAVLGGFPLKVGKEEFAYPKRYSDSRGERIWKIAESYLRSCPE